MPNVPAAVAGASLLDVTGSLPDILGAVNTLAEWAKAQEGVKHNALAFSLVEEGARQQAATPSPSTPAGVAGPRSVTVGEPRVLQPQMKRVPVLHVTGPYGAELSFFAALFRPNAEERFQFGHTFLGLAREFDTAIGSQAELEFSGEMWADWGYGMSFRGFVNPFGGGYEEFGGAVLLLPQGSAVPLHCYSARGLTSPRWTKENGYEIDVR